MSKVVVTANRLADGVVVYIGCDGSWSETIEEAKVFATKEDAEAGLGAAHNDAKRNLIVEPFIVEVAEDAAGLHAVTLREAIRARGPTIDFLPPVREVREADPSPDLVASQGIRVFS